MAAENTHSDLIRQLMTSIGLDVEERDLAITSALHASFAAQRARLDGAVRPETEPMIVPDFARVAVDRRDRK